MNRRTQLFLVLSCCLFFACNSSSPSSSSKGAPDASVNIGDAALDATRASDAHVTVDANTDANIDAAVDANTPITDAGAANICVGENDAGLPTFCPLMDITTKQLLTNPGFETNGLANWSQLSYGTGASVMVTSTTDSPHTGSNAAAITETVGTGAVVFLQNVAFTAGKQYHASVWVKSKSSVDVEFLLRDNSQPNYFPTVATERVTVGTSWQQLNITGGFEYDVPGANGNFALYFHGDGELTVDDASLYEEATDTCVPTIPAASTVFGMHVNKLGGAGYIWPNALNFGIVRMWDTGTKWSDFQPNNTTSWDGPTDVRMGLYMANAKMDNEDVIYTLGAPPSWALDANTYVNLDAWRTYVMRTAMTYPNIRYWEMWNETDSSIFYTGTVAQMVTLTQIAHDTLKAINCENRIIAPNVTNSGVSWLDQFLSMHGADNVDILSVHIYPSLTPENNLARFGGFKDLRHRYNLDTLPLWNTEGASSAACLEGSPNCPMVLSAGEQSAQVARAYLSYWSAGIQNLSWYAWDISGWLLAPTLDAGIARGYLPVLLSSADYKSVAAPGIAYENVVSWIKDATLTAKSIDATTGTWTLTIKRANYVGTIVWNPSGSGSITIPSGVTHRHDLTGATSTQSAGSLAITDSPVLLD
jgi:hypothetical protein